MQQTLDFFQEVPCNAGATIDSPVAIQQSTPSQISVGAEANSSDAPAMTHLSKTPFASGLLVSLASQAESQAEFGQQVKYQSPIQQQSNEYEGVDTHEVPSETTTPLDISHQNVPTCLLAETYVLIKHGQILLNTKYISNIQERYNVLFPICKCVDYLSRGLQSPPVLAVPSSPCCGVIRIYHKSCPQKELYKKAQQYCVDWANLFPALPPPNID